MNKKIINFNEFQKIKEGNIFNIFNKGGKSQADGDDIANKIIEKFESPGFTFVLDHAWRKDDKKKDGSEKATSVLRRINRGVKMYGFVINEVHFRIWWDKITGILVSGKLDMSPDLRSFAYKDIPCDTKLLKKIINILDEKCPEKKIEEEPKISREEIDNARKKLGL